jgi:hypothetical protein
MADPTLGPPKTEPAKKREAPAGERPRKTAVRVARGTWWLPWVLGSAAFAFAAVLAVEFFGGSDKPAGWDQVKLPTSEHRVVYSVTGAGKSPEIKYVVDGVNGTETVVNGDLPWRKELTVKVGPGLGVVQVMAANNETAEAISCSVSVDGNVVHQATSKGQGSQVSCSSAIRPSAN